MVTLAREVLANIQERGGTAHYTVLADMMRIGRYYAELICKLLGRDEYIVMDAAGRCKITPKGEDFLNKEILEEILSE
jgi:Mn-dependent DtxR family transcriptional regulator